MQDLSRKLFFAMSTVAGGFQDFLSHCNYLTNQTEFVFVENIDYVPKWKSEEWQHYISQYLAGDRC